MSEILHYLSGCQAAMVQLLERLVMLESPSSVPHAVDGVGDLLAREFRAVDASVEFLPRAGFGRHLRATWGRGDRQILLLGHMDTVWSLRDTERRPFQTAIAEDTGAQIARGPGVFDMKGGLVIGLYAVAALFNLGLNPAHRVVLLFNSDEEVGSPSSRSIIEAEAQHSEVVLVLEPSREDCLVTWRKGIGFFDLEIQGVASHSGSAHERGASAIEEMAHQILKLEGMTDYGQGTTVNVGVVHGGSKANVRPAIARAAIDLRVLTASEGHSMTEAILGLSPGNPRTCLRVSGGMNRPPWEASPTGEALFQRAKRVGAALGLDLWPAGSGGGSDGNFTAALGVPTLDGLGVVGDDAHALTEWADLGSLPVRAALLAELILDLGA